MEEFTLEERMQQQPHHYSAATLRDYETANEEQQNNTLNPPDQYHQILKLKISSMCFCTQKRLSVINEYYW